MERKSTLREKEAADKDWDGEQREMAMGPGALPEGDIFTSSLRPQGRLIRLDGGQMTCMAGL